MKNVSESTQIIQQNIERKLFPEVKEIDSNEEKASPSNLAPSSVQVGDASTEKKKEETPPLTIENVKDIVGEEEATSFNTYGDQKWVIWENIEYLDKDKNQSTNWESKAKKVAWFSDLITFY